MNKSPRSGRRGQDLGRALWLNDLADFKRKGVKIAALTAYDACFASILEEAGMDVVLIGDSLGMILHGAKHTLGVSMDEMVYHCRATAGGARHSLLLADLPFMSYPNATRALENAARLLAAGAHAVKLEGGEECLEIVRALVQRGLPVCAHLGLQPQSLLQQGGFRMHGAEPAEAARIRRSAALLEEAGAGALVLECVPDTLATELRATLRIPVIGIGAGPDCDGQVLVLHDLLGLNPHPPAFSKDFLRSAGSVRQAVADYVAAVKEGRFPQARPAPTG